jgi:RNA 2',3'-cyclic 3'-phosphodiesterase
MSRTGTARLFAAVDPPPEVAERLSRWARSVARGEGGGRGRPSLRVLEPESLHLTLLFLGERPLGEIEALGDALVAAAESQPPCEVQTAAPVWLPPRRPRALAVELRDLTGALQALQSAVARRLGEAAGVAPPRRFRPHVTVARARSVEALQEPLAPTPPLRFAVEELALYRSHLEPRAARYEPLAVAVLSR